VATDFSRIKRSTRLKNVVSKREGGGQRSEKAGSWFEQRFFSFRGDHRTISKEGGSARAGGGVRIKGKDAGGG